MKGQTGIPFFFHGVQRELGQVVALHVLSSLAPTDLCPHPVVRGDVYPGGLTLRQSCGHTLFVRTTPDLEVVDLDGVLWHVDEVPYRPPSVGGVWRPELKVPEKGTRAVLWHS